MLPSDVIVSVAYNTSDYGANPYGTGTACHTGGDQCGYDSLNVAVTPDTNSTLAVGSDPVADSAYLSSTWGGAYCDNGSSGTGTFRLDSGCWTGEQPEISLSTTLASVSQAPQGGWVGSYGSDGWDLFGWNGTGSSGDYSSLPAGVSVHVLQGARYQWANPTSDVRALESPDTTTREATTLYDGSTISVRIDFTNAYTGNLHLYAVDWDSSGRSETITVGSQTASLSKLQPGRLGVVPGERWGRRLGHDHGRRHGAGERCPVGPVPGRGPALPPRQPASRALRRATGSATTAPKAMTCSPGTTPRARATCPRCRPGPRST